MRFAPLVSTIAVVPKKGSDDKDAGPHHYYMASSDRMGTRSSKFPECPLLARSGRPISGCSMSAIRQKRTRQREGSHPCSVSCDPWDDASGKCLNRDRPTTRSAGGILAHASPSFPARADHVLRIHPAVELVFRHQAQLDRRLPQAQALGEGLLRDLRRVVVADLAIENPAQRPYRAVRADQVSAGFVVERQFVLPLSVTERRRRGNLGQGEPGESLPPLRPGGELHRQVAVHIRGKTFPRGAAPLAPTAD